MNVCVKAVLRPLCDEGEDHGRHRAVGEGERREEPRGEGYAGCLEHKLYIYVLIKKEYNIKRIKLK